MDLDEPLEPTFGNKPRPLNPHVPDDDRGPALLGFCISLTLVASFTVFARVYVLLMMQRVAGWDDVFMLLAMVSIANTTAIVQHG